MKVRILLQIGRLVYALNDGERKVYIKDSYIYASAETPTDGRKILSATDTAELLKPLIDDRGDITIAEIDVPGEETV